MGGGVEGLTELLPMKIHLLQAKRDLGCRTNKDTNGGYGTANDYGDSLASRLLAKLKSRAHNFPELAPAYAASILRAQGHAVTYGDNEVNPDADVTLLQSSIVHYNEELRYARRLKKDCPGMKVGFFAGVSDSFAEEYAEEFDFVITGEFEGALLNNDIADFSGKIASPLVGDLDTIPFPDWSHIQRDRKRNLITGKKGSTMLPMIGSRGCPMSCRFYCTYPLTQGRRQRCRSAANIIDEAEHLRRSYGMDLVMFRDPIFSMDMERIHELCEEILTRGLHFDWICETHCKFLDEQLIRIMAAAGCRSIKLGIESGNDDVMKGSNRRSQAFNEQRQVLDWCEKFDVRVIAFYILGYFDDTLDTARRTIDYARMLNTYGAQFSVATPYPGTPWFEELKKENEQFDLSDNMDDYTQYHLVYRHPHLTAEDIRKLKNRAYSRYYSNPRYLLHHHLPWKKFLKKNAGPEALSGTGSPAPAESAGVALHR